MSQAKAWRKSTGEDETAGVGALRQKGHGKPENWHGASLATA